MSEYPNTSPWGPHGPQVPAHSVTPNPTSYSSYAPAPQPSNAWPAAPSYPAAGSYTGGYAGDSGSSSSGPTRKSLILAVLLPLFLGPFGLFYVLRLRWAFLYLLVVGGTWAYFDDATSGNEMANLFCSLLLRFVSIVCCFIAVLAHNRKLGK